MGGGGGGGGGRGPARTQVGGCPREEGSASPPPPRCSTPRRVHGPGPRPGRRLRAERESVVSGGEPRGRRSRRSPCLSGAPASELPSIQRDPGREITSRRSGGGTSPPSPPAAAAAQPVPGSPPPGPRRRWSRFIARANPLMRRCHGRGRGTRPVPLGRWWGRAEHVQVVASDVTDRSSHGRRERELSSGTCDGGDLLQESQLGHLSTGLDNLDDSGCLENSNYVCCY
ncbi:homeobox protein Hox-D9-like isoform X3 [Aquila chrysaetos chrysaetos]|uniref:homeobox protein Hox-D9-like isoform X3 n=1 Tax=Aquila chrysaetos chrysaetos TaxID=223781 RepID=UPI00117721D3|nr:homeobox protein Hox-D9-like isoform X3 [Aquila chrysaetos chrysaetos]